MYTQVLVKAIAKFYPVDMSERINHADEAIRLIDAVLAEEGVVLDALRKAVERNWLSQDEADSQFQAFHDGLVVEPES